MRFLILGCGPSAVKSLGAEYADHIVVGVNDSDRFRALHYHVVVDRLDRFSEDRQNIITNTRSVCLYTHLGPKHLHTAAEETVTIDFNAKRGWLNQGLTGPYNKSFHSTYIAAQVAVRLGATSLTFAGMDIVGHPNFNRRQVVECRMHLEQMLACYVKMGIEIVNLGRNNILTGIPGVTEA